MVCPHFVEATQELRHLADAQRGLLDLVLQARAWSGDANASGMPSVICWSPRRNASPTVVSPKAAYPTSKCARSSDTGLPSGETIARANAGEAAPETEPDDESADWYARMWGDWAGREEDWFLRSAESVATMDDDELISRMDEVRHLAEAVGDRWDDLSVHDLPDRLTFTPGVGSEATPDVLRLSATARSTRSYSPRRCRRICANSTVDRSRTCATASTAHGTRLDDDLLGLLHDFGVAEPPGQ